MHIDCERLEEAHQAAEIGMRNYEQIEAGHGRVHLFVVLMVAACSVPDADTPAGEPSVSVPPLSNSSFPSGTSQATSLAAIEACDLFTAQELTSLGVSPQGRPDEIVGLRSCDWGGAEGGPSVTINENLGIDGLNLTDASSVTDLTIGRH